MSDKLYLCGDVIYTEKDLVMILKKSIEEINERFVSGKPIRINGNEIELAEVTEKDLPWIIGGSDASFCAIGIPIDIEAYNARVAAFKSDAEMQNRSTIKNEK